MSTVLVRHNLRRVMVVECRWRLRSVVFIACGVFAAGCSHDADHARATTPSTVSALQARAVAACRAGARLPSPSVGPQPVHETYLNAQATTVGNLRSYRFGSGEGPSAHAFPKAAPTAFGAWCWSRTQRGTYVAYAMGPDGTKFVFMQESGTSPPKPGRPSLDS